MNGNRKIRLQTPAHRNLARREQPTESVRQPDPGEYAALSRSELIRMIGHMQARLDDFAAPVARLSFIATLAVIPWRYRFSLLSRPAPPIYRDYTDFLLFVPDLLLVATLLLWVMSLYLRPRRVVFGPAFISLPLAGLTLVSALSALNSVDPGLSLYHTVRLLILGGFYLYIVNEIRSWRDLVMSAGLLVVPQAVTGIAQVLAQGSLNLQGLGEYQLNPAWNGVSVATANGVRFLRAYGLSDHPNILGGCLAAGLLVVGVGYAATKSEAGRDLTAAVFGLGALGLLMTLSRSAWIACMAGGFLALWLFSRAGYRAEARRLVFLGLGTGLLLVPFLIYLAPYLGTRLGFSAGLDQAPAEVQSIGERQLLNQVANQLFLEQPLTGVGLGSFPQALQQKFPEFPVNYQPAHLVLLDVAAETGLFGALFYLVLLVAPWGMLMLRRNEVVFNPSLILASALLLAVSLLGMFDYYTWLLVPGRLLAWLAWGLWAAFYGPAQRGVVQHG